jgi:drug/metabolite transporter (DMT)-like permease
VVGNRINILQKTPVVVVLATLCTMLWGIAFPALKISLKDLHISSLSEIYDFIAYRFLIAGMLMAVFIRLRGATLALPAAKDYLLVSVVALVQVCLQFVFFYIGLGHTTGVRASVINGSGTFFIIILSQLFVASENVTARKWIGTLIGFAGLVVVNFNPEIMKLSFSAEGEGMILLTALTGAFGSLLVKKVSGGISPLHINLYQFILGSVFLLAVSLATGSEHLSILDFGRRDLLLLLFLGATSAVAFTLWYLLIQHNNLSRIAVYFFMVPIWGALFSALFVDGESINMMTGPGAALVSAGIFLATRE